MDDIRKTLGLHPKYSPPALIEAHRRAREIQCQDYGDERCCIEVTAVGNDFQIRVTRISDGDVTTETIPKGF